MTAVEPDTELAIRAEPPADIEVSAPLGVGQVVAREPGQVGRGRALWNDIDDAAYAAVRGHAVQQGGRSLDHLDALGVIGKYSVIGRHAVLSVEGEFSHVAFADRKATNIERIDDAAPLAGRAD